MQHSLIRRASGFSLIEVMVSLVIYATVVTALMGYFRVIAQGLDLQWQNRQLWRQANEQADITPPVLPQGWQVNRLQTSGAGCVSITATVTSPLGRKAQLTRHHCLIH